MRKSAQLALWVATIVITSVYSLWYFSPSFVIPAAEPVDVELGGRKILAMPGEVLAYHSIDELRSAAPNGEVALNRPIDFSQQKVIRIGWRAMGYQQAGLGENDQADSLKVGQLTQLSRSGGSQIYFHIDQPIQERIAGQTVNELAHRQQMGEFWFVVDLGAKVSYSEFSRPIKFDLFVLLLMFLVAHVTVWPWVRKRRLPHQPAIEPAQSSPLKWVASN